jgi:hypothetical protein
LDFSGKTDVSTRFWQVHSNKLRYEGQKESRGAVKWPFFVNFFANKAKIDPGLLSEMQ